MDQSKDTPPPSPGEQVLPQSYVFPTQLLEKWLAVPPGQYVEARLTRQDLDQLFFGLTKTLSALQSLEAALVRWSNNDLTGANEKLFESRRVAVEADNSVRQFFAALMISATNK